MTKINKTRRTRQLLLAGAMFFSLNALSEGALQSEMEAFVVTPGTDGSESYEVARKVEPGQVIEYRTVYKNTGDSSISGLAVVGPVPAGTRYLEKSASGEGGHEFQASIDDGGSWHSEPLLRTVVKEDGSKKQEIVSPQEYTHVRWKAAGAMANNSSREYRYRVLVLPAKGGVE